MATAQARHILVDTEEKCNDLKQQIEDGADFADVARDNSSCPSGKTGGLFCRAECEQSTFAPGLSGPRKTCFTVK